MVLMLMIAHRCVFIDYTKLSHMLFENTLFTTYGNLKSLLSKKGNTDTSVFIISLDRF